MLHARTPAGSRADSVSHTAFGDSRPHRTLSEVEPLLITRARTHRHSARSTQLGSHEEEEEDSDPGLCVWMYEEGARGGTRARAPHKPWQKLQPHSHGHKHCWSLLVLGVVSEILPLYFRGSLF